MSDLHEEPITDIDTHVGEDVPAPVRCATVTIHRAGEMTPEGRKKLADWLRYHAQALEDEGDNYATRFTGQYDAVPNRHH